MQSTSWLTRCAAMAALALSGAVQAQSTAPDEIERFGLPEGCTGFVTVQYKLCQVTHHYTCEGDPEGFQHRVDLDDDGPFFVSTIDSEAQWIESLDVRSNILDTLDPAPEDPASFTDLARKGRDDFNFSTTSEVGETIIYQGRDLLTGETVVIDDVPLLRTDTYARATRPDGSLVWESRGNEYIHLDWRLFLAGQSVTRTQDGSFQDEDEPVEFHFPGDPGFLALEPEYNCRALLL